jgi:site-specific recombinase XerD
MQAHAIEQELVQQLWSGYPAYCAWLKQQHKPLHSVRAERSRIHLFLTWLRRNDNRFAALSLEQARNRALAAYLDHLQYNLRARPSTLSKTLYSINNFFNYAGLGTARVQREEMPGPNVITLSMQEQQEFVAAARLTSAKQRAIGLLLFHTGIKITDCSALNLQNLNLSEGTITVPDRDNELGRAFQLNDQETVTALHEWIVLRNQKYHRSGEDALFVNPQRRRITPAGLNLIVGKIGILAKLEVSAQVLRETWMMRRPSAPNLDRGGNPHTVRIAAD